MSRPWMPLYVADYLADTGHLGALQSGAYLHLIMHYWQRGGLPTDDAALARIARLTTAEWKREKETIAAFFQDGWRHKRIDDELAHAADVSAKRKASAEQRHNNSSANAEQKQAHARASSQPQSQETSSLRSDVTREREAEFEEQFWPAYPHKVGKPAARRAFLAARKRAELPTILAGLRRYVAGKPPDRAWMNPATFLNQDRWGDEPAAAVRPNGTGPPPSRESAATKLLKRMGMKDEPDRSAPILDLPSVRTG